MQLGHRLPVATASWLPLLFSRAATWMTRILSGAWDHTYLYLSNICNTLRSEAHWSRFRRRKNCGLEEGSSPCKEERQSYPEGQNN